jgi:predicted nucleotidyltransferase
VKLEELLARVCQAAGGHGCFAVIGAVARNAWAPPRATTDVDITVAGRESHLQAITGALTSLGYTRVREHKTDPADALPDTLIFRSHSGRPRQVDVLVAKTAFEDEVLARAEPIDIGGVKLPVASPEDLVVYKLLADRPRDRDDIRVVLRTQHRAGRRFDWEYVARWAGFWQVTDRLERLRRDFLG